jgi:hypothetical protein
MLSRFRVASTKRCKDAESARIRIDTGATEDAAARRVIASRKHKGHLLEGHQVITRSLRKRRTLRTITGSSSTSMITATAAP